MLFSKASYQVMTGDEDSLSKARVKKNVNPDIEKWADKNHVVRTFSKYLKECKSIDFGLDNDKLTDSVREYIMRCFSMALIPKIREMSLDCKEQLGQLFPMILVITWAVEIGADLKKF